MHLRKALAVARKHTIHALCDHLVGEHHTHWHRYVAGAVVMAFGVAVAKSAHLCSSDAVAFVLDGCGYMIHGIGLIPYAEAVMAVGVTETEEEDEHKHE